MNKNRNKSKNHNGCRLLVGARSPSLRCPVWTQFQAYKTCTNLYKPGLQKEREQLKKKKMPVVVPMAVAFAFCTSTGTSTRQERTRQPASPPTCRHGLPCPHGGGVELIQVVGWADFWQVVHRRWLTPWDWRWCSLDVVYWPLLG